MNLPFTCGEFITPRRRISWKVMFLQVCLFTGGGGIGRYLTPLRPAPLPTSPKKSSKAGGTHPTGMYSCLRKCINFVEKKVTINCEQIRCHCCCVYADWTSLICLASKVLIFQHKGLKAHYQLFKKKQTNSVQFRCHVLAKLLWAGIKTWLRIISSQRLVPFEEA